MIFIKDKKFKKSNFERWPLSLWIPATLCICVGLFQGIVAVANQMWDEKRKYGEVKSSVDDLTKLFLTTFAGGVLWQICSYIPLVPLLAQHILKPVAEILGSLLLGLATFIVLYIANLAVPKMVEGISASTTTFFAEPKTEKFQTPTPYTTDSGKDVPKVDSGPATQSLANPKQS